MNKQLKPVLAAVALLFATQAMAQVTFYEGENFHGRVFATSKPVPDFERVGFNDRASSVIVERGVWEVCDDAGYRGRCAVLRHGSYASLNGMGLDNRISSIRKVSDNARYDNEAPPALTSPNYDYRRRPDERMSEAQVTSVHAVVGPPSERCWVEHQQTNGGRGDPNVPGAVVGAILGGVLGHQVGNGRGNDVATAGGAVVGGLVGANVGRDGGSSRERDVKRCETAASTTPEYWDVTYDFRGVQHRVQMSAAPGRTIAVNERGEPRG
jgi:uncharacterized protein YcfJ